MKIAFRLDSSLQIGSGHVFRCLALSNWLRAKNAEVIFICRSLQGNLMPLIKNNGYKVQALANRVGRKLKGISWVRDAEQTINVLKDYNDLDWLVLDHYAIDKKWEAKIRKHVKRIMVIDDLADRQHDCDLLLDQNLYQNMETRYDKLVPRKCRKLLGPRFVLLRSEFLEVRKKIKPRNGRVRRIIIYFGSGDLTDETSKVLRAISLCSLSHIQIDIVLGINNPHKKSIMKMASSMKFVNCYNYVINMAEFMANADLFIGAGGVTTYERSCLGLPSLVITVAKNQVQAIADLSRAGCLRFCGKNNEINPQDISNHLEHLIANPAILKEYSRNSMQLVDGRGTQRCVDFMMADNIKP